MTTRTSAEVKQAFERFVDLMEHIEDVRCAVVFDDDELDFYTYIEAMDDAVMTRVHHAEIRIMEEFPDILMDFHVRYLEGKPLEAFIDPLPALSYLRGKHSNNRAPAEQ